MKFNRKPLTNRQKMKVRVKVGRLHSGNTITALKYLRKLDKEENKKNGANGISQEQTSSLVSLRNDKDRGIQGKGFVKKT